MRIDTEEKLKIVALSCVGTILLTEGRLFLGLTVFAVLVPWPFLARIAVWLVDPVLNWRMRKPSAQAIVVQAEARPL